MTIATTMLSSSWCNYSDAYIHIKGTITVIRGGTIKAEGDADRNDKEIIFKNCALFTNCLSKVKDTSR